MRAPVWQDEVTYIAVLSNVDLHCCLLLHSLLLLLLHLNLLLLVRLLFLLLHHLRRRHLRLLLLLRRRLLLHLLLWHIRSLLLRHIRSLLLHLLWYWAPALQLLRCQYFYFCTSNASKLSTCPGICPPPLIAAISGLTIGCC